MCGGDLSSILTTRGGPLLEPPTVKREGLVKDVVDEGCPGISNHEFSILKEVRREVSRIAPWTSGELSLAGFRPG